MAIWFQLALVLNVVCWTIFLFVLALRRWNWAAMAVGIVHMLYATFLSAAPFRSLLDKDYMVLSLGFLRFEGQAAALPAALFFGWALLAAWLAVANGTGRWMSLIAAGDTFLALNIGGSILLRGSQHWKFQLGEQLSVTGVPGLVVLLGFLTLPLAICAIWATRRTYSGGNTPPAGQETRRTPDPRKTERPRSNGFRYVTVQRGSF